MKKDALLSVGSCLQQLREEKGLSIEYVASQLKIRKSYIAAIESGNTKILKFDAYTIGYIKHYCMLLGLDHKQYIDSIKNANFSKIDVLAKNNFITEKEFLPSKAVLYSSVAILMVLYIIVEFAR